MKQHREPDSSGETGLESPVEVKLSGSSRLGVFQAATCLFKFINYLCLLEEVLIQQFFALPKDGGQHIIHVVSSGAGEKQSEGLSIS